MTNTKKIAFSIVAVVLFFALLEAGLAVTGVQPVVWDEDPYVGFESSVAQFEPDDSGQFLERRTYADIIEQPPALRSLQRVLGHSRTYALVHGFRQRGAERAEARYELTGEVDEILNRSRGLDAYKRDDHLQAQVLEHYRFNVRRMLQMAATAGAGAIVTTIPVNERDFPPFKSEFHEGTDPQKRQRIEGLIRNARAGLEAGASGEVRELMEEAVALDPWFADSHYLLGRAGLAQEDYALAESSFRTALERDVCPLRAWDAMNLAIAEAAREAGAAIVDFRRGLKEVARRQNGHDLLGDEHFLDHVHPTVAAHGLLARALVDEMARMNVVQLPGDWHDELGEGVIAEIEGRADAEAHARAYKNLSKVLLWAGKREAAERYVRQAEEILGDDWELLYNRGVLEFEAGNAGAAIAGLDEALRLNPQAALAHDQLGTIHAGLGNLSSAVDHGERAVHLEPGLASAHSNLSASYLARGDTQRALESARRASKLAPKLGDAFNNLGNAHFALEQLEAAAQAYGTAVELDPSNSDARVNRGLVLAQAGHYDEALACFAGALQIDDRKAAALVGRGKVLLATGDTIAAASAFSAAIVAEPSLVEPYEWLARLQVDQRSIDDAKRTLSQGLTAAPGSPTLHNLLAQILRGEGQYDEAVRQFRHAIAGWRDNPDPAVSEDQLHHGLATTLLAGGDLTAGVAALRRAEAINPQNPLVQFDLGLVHEGLARPDEAMAHFRRALELNPNFHQAREKLLQLEGPAGVTCVTVARRKTKQLTQNEYKNLQKRYRNILTRGEKELPPIPPRQNGKRGRIAKSDAHNLWERLKRHETAVLLFAKRPHVAFTNNRAERDLRMSKVKQKVSGCFRTRQYAEAYCRISSYLQTMAYKGYNPLVAIQLALSGQLYADGGA